MPEKAAIQTINVKAPEGQMIAPKHLIEVIGLSHWTLSTHKIWLALLNNAWGERLEDPTAEFSIPLAVLRGSHNANDRVDEQLLIIQRTVISAIHGEDTTRVQMLGHTTLPTDGAPTGTLRYSWPKALIKILRNPAQYGKLDLKTVSAFTSKYALRLYELAAQRVELHKQVEEIPLDHFRELLGVPADKLATWSDLRRYAIEPAMAEVNGLSAFTVNIEPVKVGRAVTRVRMSWAKKAAFSAAERNAVAEVNRAKVGRKARLSGSVETVVDAPKALLLSPQALRTVADFTESQGCRLDMAVMYQRWLGMWQGSGNTPDNPIGNFKAFCMAEVNRQR